jgi:hypothetical protein
LYMLCVCSTITKCRYDVRRNAAYVQPSEFGE